MRSVLSFLAGMLLAASAHALSLADITGKDASGGLKEALIQGAGKAVEMLGKQDGFLGNPKVKIPLPESVQKIEGVLRGFGMGQQADELINAMNRAATAAVRWRVCRPRDWMQDSSRRRRLAVRRTTETFMIFSCQ